MTTQVRYHKTSPTNCSGDNLKKLLLYVLEQPNVNECLDVKIKVSNTKMLISKVDENIYSVIKFELIKHSWTPYVRETKYIFQVVKK